MRVTHIITRLILGGAQENTIDSVLGLRQKPNLEVNLISGPTVGPEGSLEAKVAAQPGVLTIAPSLARPLHPWKDVRAWFELTRLLRKQAPDLVHTHSGKAGILGRLAARRARVPLIVHTIHGPSFGPFQGALANRLFVAAERSAARVTTHFVSVAHAMTEEYLAAGVGKPGQFTRIFSGFALGPFLAARNDPAVRARWALTPDDLVVAKIARLTDLKGHEDLFALVPELVRRCPRIKFLLVGDGRRRSGFEEKVRTLGLAGHVKFTGLVEPAEMPALIGMADVVVHLSYREGLPRALSQALAASRPIVAYDCNGVREICLPGQTGFLLRPGDIRELRDRLLELAGDATLRERLGRAGQQLVREWFPVERMVEELYSLYQRLASGRTDRESVVSSESPARGTASPCPFR